MKKKEMSSKSGKGVFSSKEPGFGSKIGKTKGKSGLEGPHKGMKK